MLLAGVALYAATVPNAFQDGDTLSATKLNANFDAVATPAGTIVAFGGTSAPSGWLLCNGSTVSRGTYATLFAAIGTSFGAGDGASTFHLPDLRGRFLRGRDTTAGRDPNAATRSASNSGGNSGDAVGSLQSDAFQGHWHDLNLTMNGATGGAGDNTGSNAIIRTGAVQNASTDGTNGTPRTTSETRPVNVYVNYIIKQ